jgi:Bifunctional DNA primase/polymerase, N-terminal
MVGRAVAAPKLTLLEAAAAYAQRGWPVFPARPDNPGCGSPGGCVCKAPGTAHGVDDATTDLALIERYWDRSPEANVAIATGGAGPAVLDVDVAHGRPGYASLRQAIKAGLVPPPTVTVRTPSGGAHLYYAAVPGQRNGSLPAQGLDWRAERGYVLAPPSAVHGRPYVLTHSGGDMATIDFNGLRSYFQPSSQPAEQRQRDGPHDTSRLADWVARLQPGNRNSGLWWAAWRAAQARDHATITQISQAALTTGLGRPEIDRTIASAMHTADHPRDRAQRQAR